MGYIDVSAQALTFLMSLGLGAVLCLLYDVVRALHKTFIKGFLEVLVCDILFWCVAAFLTFCFLIIRCFGSVRVFVLVGELIGAVITRYTLSRLFLPFLSKILRLISAVGGFLRVGFGKLFISVEKIIKKMLLIVKKGLQPKALLLYNLLNVRNKREAADPDEIDKEM